MTTMTQRSSLPRPLYYLGNARDPKQHAEMVALERAGICIFCPSSYQYSELARKGGNWTPVGRRESLLRFRMPDGRRPYSYRKQVLLANGTWAILRNEYPYPGTAPNGRHLLLVPSHHVTAMDQLDGYSRQGFWDILDAAIVHFAGGDNYYYGLGIRNGDMRFTGGTIAHLHIQFVVGDPNADERVQLFLSSKPDRPTS